MRRNTADEMRRNAHIRAITARTIVKGGAKGESLRRRTARKTP